MLVFPNLMPKNLITVKDWSTFGRKAYGVNWVTAAKKYATIKGIAQVHKANGSLVVFTRTDSGSIAQTTFKPNTWMIIS